MRSILLYIAIFPIKVYQACISPFFPASCRHVPTCSQYAIEAIREWGPLTGGIMAIKRISRCHPWGSSGFDPVPKKGVPKDAGTLTPDEFQE